MATPTQQQARSHYARQAAIGAAAVNAARRLLPEAPDQIPRVISSYQVAAASFAVQKIAEWANSVPVTRVSAFSGVTSEGFPLDVALAPLVNALLRQIEAEVDVEMHRLDRAVASQVADAGRSASQVEFVARPLWTNYVRLLSPPSCGRCAVLAGRIYRDLDGFARHPGCDCVMVPVENWEAAHDAGLVSSPADAFRDGKVRGLSKADARAIADGADPTKVVNARRGTSVPGVTAAKRVQIRSGRRLSITADGTTKRAAWRKANPNLPFRLRPESIYDFANGDRAEAIRLLRVHGYLTS